eukprot:2157689-Pyramimonas_sp.AAC.1
MHSHAAPPPSTAALRGPIGGPTEGPSGAARMRHPHPVQRHVAPQTAPPNAPVAPPACVTPP